MKRFALVCAVTVLAGMATACNQTLPDTRDADIAAVRAADEKVVQDFAAKDLDKIVSHYADDAVVMEPGQAMVAGIAAVRNSFKPLMGDAAFVPSFTITRVDVANSGDLGYAEGSYAVVMTEPTSKQVIHDHGSFVTIYRKQADGVWKVVSDILTSAAPPAPPPAPVSTKKK